jgi:hypothetical protein
MLLSAAAFTFSPSVEHIPADVALRGWRSRVFECVGIPEVRFDRVLGKEKALKDEKALFRADPYVASTTLCKHNTAAPPVGTAPTSSALQTLLNSARTKNSDMRLKCSSATFPFGTISPVLHAAVPSEVQVSMLQAEEAKEEAAKVAKEAMPKQVLKKEATRHRHRLTHESNSVLNPVPRSHATGSTTPHLLLLAPTPLVVNVDAANGNNAPSCVESPTLACKTIRYALEKGQLEAPKQRRSLLVIEVAVGEYLGECAEEGNTVAMAITLKKKGGGGEVLIDCNGAGSLLNITHDASDTSHLEGITITNGVSKRGGGAASVRGGRMVLKECVFRQLKSLADGDFVGGGAVSFEVSAVLRIV